MGPLPGAFTRCFGIRNSSLNAPPPKKKRISSPNDQKDSEED